MSGVPYTFASATSSIPLSELDSNFATPVTIGTTSVTLGNTVTTLANVSLSNVTISSVASVIPNNFVANSSVIVNGTSNVAIASANGAVTMVTNGNTAVTIDTSQNVGIGTASPVSKMEVAVGTAGGSLNITNTANTNTAKLRVTTSQSSMDFGEDGTGGVVEQLGAYPIRFYNNSTERMRIDSSGNLLIGYTSSNGSYKLQVNSQIFATSSTIATSDARYKENVEELSGALDIVKALRPVSFDWKAHPIHNFDTTTKTVGFLAQDVQQTLAGKPYLNSIIKTNECVIEPEVKDENGNVTKEAVTEEFLGIAEGNMISILTAAIQELSAQVTTLQTQVTALQAKG